MGSGARAVCLPYWHPRGKSLLEDHIRGSQSVVDPYIPQTRLSRWAVASGQRKAERLSDLSGASEGSADCQQTTNQAAVQNSPEGWIFSVSVSLPLGLDMTQRSSPNPPVVRTGKRSPFQGPRNSCKEVCGFRHEKLGLREGVPICPPTPNTYIPEKPLGSSKWEEILVPDSSQDRNYSTGEILSVVQTNSGRVSLFSGTSVHK